MTDGPTAALVALVALLAVLGVVAPAGTAASAVTGSAVADPAAQDEPTAVTEISGCTAITESGEYLLADDVANGSPTTPRTGLGACITIRADDVTLRGANHTVAAQPGGGPGVVGVLVGGGQWVGGQESGGRVSNVTVTNLTTTRWGAGVAIVGAADTALRNVSAVNNLGDGFFVENSPGAELVGGEVRGSNTGVFLRRSPDARLADLTVTENLAGISVRQSDAAMVSAVEASQNSQFGIAVFASANATVRHSTVAGNGFAGVALARADDGLLRNLTVLPKSTPTPSGISSVGVYLNDSAGVRLSGVSVADTPGWALYATGDSTAVGERVRFESAEIGFEVRDVALDSADAPPLPTGKQISSPALARRRGTPAGFRPLRSSPRSRRSAGAVRR